MSAILSWRQASCMLGWPRTPCIAEDALLECLGYRLLLPSLACVVLEIEPRASCILGMCSTNHRHSSSLASGLVCQLTGLGHYKLLKLFSSSTFPIFVFFLLSYFPYFLSVSFFLSSFSFFFTFVD